MFYSKKLKKFNNIKHCFFSRKGGFSKDIYKSLNCGRGSKDSKKNILKNLKYVANKFNVKNNKFVLAKTYYGGDITAVVLKDNIIGTQFHPEKSQAAGIQFIKNFLEWAP